MNNKPRSEYGVIYVITNKLNGMVYVGQTTRTIKHRFSRHCQSGADLHRAILKYGKENFQVEEVVSAKTGTELTFMENYCILCLDSANNKIGYNVKPRAKGCSEEVRKRISEGAKRHFLRKAGIYEEDRLEDYLL